MFWCLVWLGLLYHMILRNSFSTLTALQDGEIDQTYQAPTCISSYGNGSRPNGQKEAFSPLMHALTVSMANFVAQCWWIFVSMFQQTIYKAVFSSNQVLRTDAPNLFLFFSPHFFDAWIKVIKLSWPTTAWKKRDISSAVPLMRISGSLLHLQHLLVWMVSLVGSLFTSHVIVDDATSPSQTHVFWRWIAAVQNAKKGWERERMRQSCGNLHMNTSMNH